MAEDPAKKKEELVQILSDVEAKAQRLEVLGQDIVRSARLSRDVVGPIRDLLFHVPVANLSSERLDREVTGWRSWYVAASEVETARTSVNSFVALASAVALPVAFLVDAPWNPVVPGRAIAAVVHLGLVPTALAMAMYYQVVASAGPTFLALTNYLIPLVAVAAGIFVLGERPTWSLFAALCLVLTGIAVARR